MKLKEYEKIVKHNSKKEDIIKNVFLSFVGGGTLGVLGQLFVKLLQKCFEMPLSECYMYLMILLVFIGSLLTGLGVFDKAVNIFKCGLIVPTTGFAHAMTSAAMDHKSEGPVKGIGTNIFLLTGNVILYGLVAAFFLALIKGVIM